MPIRHRRFSKDIGPDDEFFLSSRPFHVLKNRSITDVWRLCQWEEWKIEKLMKMGPGSVCEIKQKLAEFDLRLGLVLDEKDWIRKELAPPPPSVEARLMVMEARILDLERQVFALTAATTGSSGSSGICMM